MRRGDVSGGGRDLRASDGHPRPRPSIRRWWGPWGVRSCLAAFALRRLWPCDLPDVVALLCVPLVVLIVVEVAGDCERRFAVCEGDGGRGGGEGHAGGRGVKRRVECELEGV